MKLLIFVSTDSSSNLQSTAYRLHLLMVIWLISLVLFVAWLTGKVVFGKGGFIHVLLLCAVAVALVQWVHERRAAQN